LTPEVQATGDLQLMTTTQNEDAGITLGKALGESTAKVLSVLVISSAPLDEALDSGGR